MRAAETADLDAGASREQAGPSSELRRRVLTIARSRRGDYAGLLLGCGASKVDVDAYVSGAKLD
jgi:hypothetical protein